MPAPLFFEELDDPIHLPGFLIAAVTSQGIEYIRQHSDPAEDVRLLAFQLKGVAGAIPLFMVLAGSGSGAWLLWCKGIITLDSLVIYLCAGTAISLTYLVFGPDICPARNEYPSDHFQGAFQGLCRNL